MQLDSASCMCPPDRTSLAKHTDKMNSPEKDTPGLYLWRVYSPLPISPPPVVSSSGLSQGLSLDPCHRI